jgi:hypothetical protein
MRPNNDKPLKTRKQLKDSAVMSMLMALGVSIAPVAMYIDYKRFGFFYTDRGRIFAATGTEALTIIYGIGSAALILWIMAGYNCLRSAIKIKKGEYSEQDEAPEFVICTSCGEPQLSKHLQEGHCRQCAGMVEAIEGYYDRHPELAPASQAFSFKKHSHSTTTEFSTCTTCGKTFYKEDCPDSVCMDCRTI